VNIGIKHLLQVSASSWTTWASTRENGNWLL